MEGKETLKRKIRLQTKLDSLGRREAFLEGRKEHLLSQIRKVEEEIFGNFFAPPAPPPARIYKVRSSFQDSGNLNLLFSIVFVVTSQVNFTLCLTYICASAITSNFANAQSILYGSDIENIVQMLRVKLID